MQSSEDDKYYLDFRIEKLLDDDTEKDISISDLNILNDEHENSEE